MPLSKLILISLLPGLLGCQAIINKRTVIVERAGTVVVTMKDSQKIEALCPDETGKLVPADIIIPSGSQVKIGEPQAPKPEVKK